MLYQAVLAAAMLVAAPILLASRARHYLPTVSGRLGGHRGRVVRNALWLHGVSVGEARVAGQLARRLPSGTPLLVTTTTPTGQAEAERSAPDDAAVAYFPFDLGLPVRRFLERFAPRALVLVEGDYWPLLLQRLNRRQVPAVVVNGRVSERSFRRLRRIRPWTRLFFNTIRHFGVQTTVDRDRLVELGVPEGRISVTGNLKFEVERPAPITELEEAVRGWAAERAVWIAGSTMADEEEVVLDAFGRSGRGTRALLVLAPRHPERFDSVAKTITRAGYRMARRSNTKGNSARPDVVLLDSLGELAAAYALCTGAFVGGTLVPTGGHNPIEPAVHGVPIAVGPSMHNFAEIADAFDRAEAWRRVTDAPSLAALWEEWLDGPSSRREVGLRAQRLVDANRGAAEATLQLLQPLLAERPGAGTAAQRED